MLHGTSFWIINIYYISVNTYLSVGAIFPTLWFLSWFPATNNEVTEPRVPSD